MEFADNIQQRLLLIQDKVCLRFLATNIFSEFSSEHYRFDYDILELDSLSQ